MPRTLAQNAQYIAETIKPAIKSAIEAQGVTVPSTDSFLDYADRIGEIEGGGSGYQLKDLPSGSISTVTDAAELPLNALKVSVEAVQSGSGTPSPSNIRPISGWDSGEITVDGFNQWDEEWEEGTLNPQGQEQDNQIDLRSKNFNPIKGGVDYYYALNTEITGLTRYVFWYDADKNFISYILYNTNVKTAPLNACYFKLVATSYIRLVGSYQNNICFNISDVNLNGRYEPYNPDSTTTSQQFPQTIYGAEWDVVGGQLKVTDGYIASYNGETLPSTWISDRDEYASGTTPTTGAEVVYKLATPTTIDLSPLSIRLLEGTNNIFADCGEVIEGEYFVNEGAHRYQLYDYIESDGTQVIDLGRQVSSGDTFDIHFGTTNTTSGWSVAWCAYTGSSITGMGFSGSLSNRQYFDNNVQKSTITTARNSIYSDTFTVSNDMSANICIFAANVSAESSSIYRLYSFAINGDYYLPCRRKSDGVFGLWDVANQAFLGDSAGGNAFVGGNPTGVEV